MIAIQVTLQYLFNTKPTYEQIDKGFVGELDNGDRYTAKWYPQMGGYGSVCWVISLTNPEPDLPCFDVIVFHDGQFPFDPEKGREGFLLHHCDHEQFIKFGREVGNFLTADPQDS